ncbi:MAG TPA: hypothetical protein VFE01_09645 [Terracidiphilus sp.]|jgi:hypothetical protein|nr:hypothetical protein [Terracidiphilus sp.]
MERRAILKGLAVTTAVFPMLSDTANAESGKCDSPGCVSDAGAVRQFLSDFLRKEEFNLDHKTLVKLMQERGRACCRALTFRQDLIANSRGDIDELVRLMGKIVGPASCTRAGNTITLIYPVEKCVCGWSPQRVPIPDDPYCECSAANNRLLFESVSGKTVVVKVVESPRRGGLHCKFQIQLA